MRQIVGGIVCRGKKWRGGDLGGRWVSTVGFFYSNFSSPNYLLNIIYPACLNKSLLGFLFIFLI